MRQRGVGTRTVASWECQRCHGVNPFSAMECESCDHDGRRPVVARSSEDLRARTTGDRPAYGPMEDSWRRMEGEAQQDYVARMSLICKDLAGRMFGGGQ